MIDSSTVQTVFFSPYRFAVVIVDVVGVWNEDEAVPPFLVLLQILKERAREDGFVLQRNLQKDDTFQQKPYTLQKAKTYIFMAVHCTGSRNVKLFYC